MTTVLAFDTSAAHCAAALLVGDKVVHRTDDMARGQAEHLMPMLHNMLQDARLAWTDLDVIGVGVGPGNFTGIRISVAAARGLALGLGVPAVGVSTFEAIAHGTSSCVVALKAPQDGLYLQSFVQGDDPTPRYLTGLRDGDVDKLTQREAVFLGDGVDRLTNDTDVVTGQPVEPLCVAMAHIARGKLASKQFERPKPLYLKPPDAAPSRRAAPVVFS